MFILDLLNNRTKRISRGSDLPIEIYFPCTLSIDQSQIFVIGFPQTGTSLDNITIAAYIFDQTNETWTYIGDDFPCQYNGSFISRAKFTCAYLRHELSIVTGSDKCVAVFHLESFTWTRQLMPYQDGILFNINSERKSVYYIGTVNTNSSVVYEVKLSGIYQG